MAMSTLTIDGEFRYVIQWFNEWSELQREDFIPELVELLNRDMAAVQVNGVVSTMANISVTDKPMSLFQCRMKLFREWTPKWSHELRHQLLEKIREIDAKIGEKVTAGILIHDHDHDHVNSDCNGKLEAELSVDNDCGTIAHVAEAVGDLSRSDQPPLPQLIAAAAAATASDIDTRTVDDVHSSEALGTQSELDEQVRKQMSPEHVLTQTA